MADPPVFDEIADALYALAPADFTVARNARADEVKKADPQLAKRVRALHRPTHAAWAANLLAHRHGDLVGQLLDLGRELRDAQQHLAGDRLRTLTDRRRRLVRELTEQAQQEATAAGHPLGADAAADVDRTLSAALADPDAARALAGGRLTAALEPPLWPGAAPAGTETGRPDAAATRTAEAAPADGKGSAARTRTRARAEREHERENEQERANERVREREREREREQARAAVAASERAEREAADRAADAARELRRATSARQRAQEEADRAAAALAQARERDGSARTALARADDRVRAAEDTADAARARASRAREAGQAAAARLRALEDDGGR
ncbi:hypothetical protein ACIRST_09740 [Kitasatospora sp. NPDC101447]|uniref:hypothetical protein n=1 Tax=Kitasatospora sp. NPDC101447 TaxID=3364102 RepID=UPI0037F6A579